MIFKKLDRKGFTLIELLAVIVILAVIMVIATTSVLSAMNESRKKSLINSAESAASSFDTKYAELTLVNSSEILGISVSSLTSGTPQSFSGADLDALNINDVDYDLANSFVYFNPSNSTFLVCFVADDTGSFYVASASDSTSTAITGVTGKSLSGMWACSNGQYSWQ